MRKFCLLIIKIIIPSLFFTFLQLNFSNADSNLCKIENNKLWTKLGSTVANEKSAEDLYKKLKPEIVSSFYNQVSNGSIKNIQFEPYYSWIEFDKLESLQDAAGDEIKRVEMG
jgi:hypothetical protein